MLRRSYYWRSADMIGRTVAADGSALPRGGDYLARGWRWVVRDHRLCRRMRQNTDVRFPVSPNIQITGSDSIMFHPDDLNNFQGMGNYFQGVGTITIGRGTYIAMNVGMITANHREDDPSRHAAPKPICIGEACWIGMNAVILPGVTLGNHTVVGAGAIVTKSFPDGYCVVAGNPAKLIRKLRSTACDS